MKLLRICPSPVQYRQFCWYWSRDNSGVSYAQDDSTATLKCVLKPTKVKPVKNTFRVYGS
jgi:hypothetical protein